MVERSIFSSLDYRFGTELQLSFRVTKQRIDSFFIKEHPSIFEDYGSNNGVAVIANVKAIQTVFFPGNEPGYEEVKIGEGELVDILFSGGVYF